MTVLRDDSETWTKGHTMSEQNKAVVRRLIDDHWNNKNADLVSELFTSNVSLHTPDGALTGHEGAASLLQLHGAPEVELHREDLLSGEKVKTRGVTTIVSYDERISRAYEERDGQEILTMELHFRRAM